MQEHMLTQYRTALLHFVENSNHLREKYALNMVDYPPHQKLLQQAAAPHSVFVLSAGLVKVVRTTSLGQAFTLGVFERGELLGDVEAIMNMHYFGTVETVTRCRLWKIAPAQFLMMLSQEPEFNLLILKATISKMLNTSHKAAIQNTNKLYYSLLIVLREFSRLEDLQITKQLLAEALGTSVRNLNRLLVGLEEKMIIKIKHSLIKEINLQGLDQQIHVYENAIQ
jgi:CRP-like cAMP-binding protein